MLSITERLRVCDTLVFRFYAVDSAIEFLCSLLFYERRDFAHIMAIDQRSVPEKVILFFSFFKFN